MPPHGEGRGLMPQSNLVVATVDDDRRVRESVQSVLESAGYEAVTFESAETFLLSGALVERDVRHRRRASARYGRDGTAAADSTGTASAAGHPHHCP